MNQDFKYVSREPYWYNKVTGGAAVLLVKLQLQIGKDNLIHKTEFRKKNDGCGFATRTFNKYWNQLVEADFIRKTPFPKVWMVNPDYTWDSRTNRIMLMYSWNNLEQTNDK